MNNAASRRGIIGFLFAQNAQQLGYTTCCRITASAFLV
jgi:hypothetical protein